MSREDLNNLHKKHKNSISESEFVFNGGAKNGVRTQ